MNCLFIAHTVCLFCIHRLRKFSEDANHLNIIQNISDLHSIKDNRTKNLILNYVHDDEQFINNFLPQL